MTLPKAWKMVASCEGYSLVMWSVRGPWEEGRREGKGQVRERGEAKIEEGRQSKTTKLGEAIHPSPVYE